MNKGGMLAHSSANAKQIGAHDNSDRPPLHSEHRCGTIKETPKGLLQSGRAGYMKLKDAYLMMPQAMRAPPPPKGAGVSE